jgi:hypothetical protein
MDEKSLIVGTLLGSTATIIATVIKTWLDRRTYTSNHLFDLRIEALKGVWQVFTEMRDVFARRVSMDFSKWKSDCGPEAKEALRRFRKAIDCEQVILPVEIIEVLREIDGFYSSTEDDKEVQPGQFVNKVNQMLETLTMETNRRMSRQRHSIRLRFRT